MGCVVGMSGGYIPIEHMSWGFGLAVMMAVQVSALASLKTFLPLTAFS